MGRPLFSVVIPTLGRPSLPKTLDSIDRESCEIIVVADTFEASWESIAWIGACAGDFGARFLMLDAGVHDTGSPQLHLGFSLAEGQYILNAGDDDIYEPDAFDLIAEIMAGNPRPLMFKVLLYPSPQRGNQAVPVMFWREQRIAEGMVTGQSFVCPNVRGKLGRWVNDWTFMRETVALWDGRIDWRDELTMRCY